MHKKLVIAIPSRYKIYRYLSRAPAARILARVANAIQNPAFKAK